MISVLIYIAKSVQVHIPDILVQEPKAIDFFVVWILLFLVALFYYKIVKIPNYLQIGDEAHYWSTSLLDDGKWNSAYLAMKPSFRGYWVYVLPTVARYLGKWTGIDASVIWMLFPSAAMSWLSTMIMPDLYQCLTGLLAKRIHSIPIILCILTVWNYLLTSVMTDLFGVVTLFASITNILKYFNDGKKSNAIKAGIVSAISCNFRLQNVLGIIAAIICGYILNRKKNHLLIVKRLSGFGMAVIIFLIISLPQFAINIQRGHLGFLPHDQKEAWDGRSAVVWNSDVALTYGNVGYLFYATDDQMLTMKSQIYDKATELDMKQNLNVYMYSPVETLMLMVKKIIIGFDIKTNVAYPLPGNPVPWRETSGMLFSLWNYLILYCALFCLIYSHKVSRNERILAVAIFVAMVIPQTIMKIEWRYVIAGYMYLYYFFSFHFCDGLLLDSPDEKKTFMEKTHFLSGMAVFMFAYLTCSFTFIA